MKKGIKIISTIIFSLLIIGAVPIKSELISDNFNFIENEFMQTSYFIQNGIKVEYSVNQPIYKEYNSIQEQFKKVFGEDIQLKNNSIVYKDSFKEVTALIWKDDEKTNVQISYLNNDENDNIFKLRNELKQIQNIAAENIKYFNFIKVKIIEEQKQHILETIENNVKKDTLEVIDIHNGSVAKGELKDGNRINIGYIKYDTGEYLIIGTPVIFVTY